MFFISQPSPAAPVSATNGRKMVNLKSASSRQLHRFKWYMQFLRVLLPVPLPLWCSSLGFVFHSAIRGGASKSSAIFCLSYLTDEE